MSNVNSMKTFEVKKFNTKNFDLEKCCRVCRSSNNTMSSIFDNENKIIDKIKFCTGILLKEEEGIPAQICIICLKNLSVAHKFKTSCLLSEQMFQKVLSDRVKKEVALTDINNDHNFQDDLSDILKEEIGTYDIKNDHNYTYPDNNYIVGTEIKIEVDDEPCQNNVKIENIDTVFNTKAVINRTTKVQKHKQKAKVKEKSELKKSPERHKNCKKNVKTEYEKKLARMFCTRCDIQFSKTTELYTHNREMHLKLRICEFCGKEFRSAGNLRTHALSHVPPRFECAHCDYKTNSKYNLSKHMMAHFGIKNYKCHLCDVRYTTRSNLNKHKLNNHGIGVKKIYKCTLCDRVYSEKKVLDAHVDGHNNIKRFKCDNCGTQFSRRCHWRKHMRKQHNVVLPRQRPGPKKLVDSIEVPGVSASTAGRSILDPTRRKSGKKCTPS